VWTADDALWEKVAGKHTVLCPECFDALAFDAGVFLRWKPIVDWPK
jgi:hypothetical protein